MTQAAHLLWATVPTHPRSPTTAHPPALAQSPQSAAGMPSTVRIPTPRRCTAHLSADLLLMTRTRMLAMTLSRTRLRQTTTQDLQVRFCPFARVCRLYIDRRVHRLSTGDLPACVCIASMLQVLVTPYTVMPSPGANELFCCPLQVHSRRPS